MYLHVEYDYGKHEHKFLNLVLVIEELKFKQLKKIEFCVNLKGY